MKLSKIEDKWVGFWNAKFVKHKGYVPRVNAYVSFGSTEKVRFLARVVLRSKNPKPSPMRRGIRTLFTAQVPGVKVTIHVDGVKLRHKFVTNRGGYIDKTIKLELEPGWHNVTYEIPDVIYGETDDTTVVDGKLLIISPLQKVGIISDIDDTIQVSNVPRVLVAAATMLAASPHKRKHVTGMPELFEYISETYSKTIIQDREKVVLPPPTIYLSATPWNVEPNIRRFMASHKFPFGPMILKDLGPTETAFYESAEHHKNTQIKELFKMFPDMKWILIGDNGQFDVTVYRNTAEKYPTKVEAIMIRELTPQEQFIGHFLPIPLTGVAKSQQYLPILHGGDGFELLESARKYLS